MMKDRIRTVNGDEQVLEAYEVTRDWSWVRAGDVVVSAGSFFPTCELVLEADGKSIVTMHLDDVHVPDGLLEVDAGQGGSRCVLTGFMTPYYIVEEVYPLP